MRTSQRLRSYPLAALVLLAVSVLFAHPIPARAGVPRPQPPGVLIDVGGYRLHVLCQGEGSPTVVLDAGSGGFSLDWALVWPAIARQTRVCVYDRAGLGWSEPGPPVRDAEQAVAELATLLDRAGETGPYVLAGHSAGGVRMQLFTLRYPERVAGLVLIDSSHDLMVNEQLALLDAGTRAALEELLRSPGFGAEPPPPDLDPAAVAALLPPELLPLFGDYLALIMQPAHQQAVAEEAAAFTPSRLALREARRPRDPLPFADLPLAVLIPGLTSALASVSTEPTPTEQVFMRVDTAIGAYLASLSTNGRLIRAERSGHFIQLDQPELVIEAIRLVVDQARARTGSE